MRFCNETTKISLAVQVGQRSAISVVGGKASDPIDGQAAAIYTHYSTNLPCKVYRTMYLFKYEYSVLYEQRDSRRLIRHSTGTYVVYNFRPLQVPYSVPVQYRYCTCSLAPTEAQDLPIQFLPRINLTT